MGGGAPALPGGGPTKVPLTEADIYITGNGGNANDLCMIRATNDDNDCKVPHTFQVEPVKPARPTNATGQFEIADERSPQEIAELIRSLGYEPVWKDWDAVLTA